MDERSIAIIGGGPAGSSAAFHLARGGFLVTVIESKAFPRLKVCGEYISPAAAGTLESIISATELTDAGARPIGEFVIELGTRRKSWSAPAAGWAVSRSKLDTLL